MKETKMKVRRLVVRSIVSVVIGLTCCAHAQGVQDEPQVEIHQLIDGLEHSAVAGSPVDQFFSPSVRVSEKTKIDALQARGFLNFEIVDYTLKDLRFQDTQHASLPATVKWSTRTEEASTTTTLRFVKEQGAWYFDRADFWEVSVGWFFFPLIAIAIAYGIGAVLMYRHVDRQRWVDPRRKTLWSALSIVPFLPFLYFARKPWSTP